MPVPSSGAWKSIRPIGSLPCISVCPADRFNIGKTPSPVPVVFIVRPLSATWVKVTSASAPNVIAALSEFKIKSSVTVKSPVNVPPAELVANFAALS